MIEIIATLVGVLGGVIGTFLSVQGHMRQIRKDYQSRLDQEMQRQADAKVKAYAAERDFEHLRRHHEQLKIAVAELQDETEEVKAKLIELQVTSKGAFHRIEQIAAKVEVNTMGSRPQQ